MISYAEYIRKEFENLEIGIQYLTLPGMKYIPKLTFDS